MNYDELRDLCKTAKISLSDVASELDMSLDGLKLAFERQSLPIRLVKPICEKFAISPNTFFGVIESRTGDVIHGNQNKFGRKQIINENKETIKILQDQLATKDEQIKMLMELLKSKNHE
ncbi:MAG: hypothetical protein KBS70_03410 [Bacteroidales bacterium]|nr:hypothetical protein [Candidatus Colicola equi]